MALLLAGLSACGGGASTNGTTPASVTEDDRPALGAANEPGERGDNDGDVAPANAPTGDGTTDGEAGRPAGGSAGGSAGASPDEGAGPAVVEPAPGSVAEPAAGTPIDPTSPAGGGGALERVDDTFDLTLLSVEVSRRSTGERVPIEVVGVSSGELRFVSDDP